MESLEASIEELWRRRGELSTSDEGARATVKAAIELLDAGAARVAEVDESGEVVVHEWLREAILLLFALSRLTTTEIGPLEFADKIPLKKNYLAQGVRVVPGATARWGAFLDRGVILMPSYVNIGARVGAETLVDTWATVGSCAQIGARVHLSGGVGIGGVLEPPNTVPVVVEDEALIGSRSILTEGARVGRGAVLGAGSILTGSMPVIDAATGEEISRGRVPPWSVAVGASRRRQFAGGEFFLPCVLVIRHLEAGKRHDKAQLNEILRDSGVTPGVSP
ncbi:MAG TPA: 2,3,4,5-tetrahydropyridine-2,6-dicarboxylate N-succinyltransferase [Acidimicrobiales bacterium]|nr:2,3,4,5-tetrahydropyridine-2,6-dicarboxylate N-succinyltransferase [Acidimicrobiales bacterium]